MGLFQLTRQILQPKPKVELPSATPPPQASVLPFGALFREPIKDGDHQGRNVIGDLMVRTMNSGANWEHIVILASYYDWPYKIWLSINVTIFPEVYQYQSGDFIQVHARIHHIQGDNIYLDIQEIGLIDD